MLLCCTAISDTVITGLVDPIWEVVAIAPPDSYLLLVYLEDGNLYRLQAVNIYKSDKYYRLVGGISLILDIDRSKISQPVIVAVKCINNEGQYCE